MGKRPTKRKVSLAPKPTKSPTKATNNTTPTKKNAIDKVYKPSFKNKATTPVKHSTPKERKEKRKLKRGAGADASPKSFLVDKHKSPKKSPSGKKARLTIKQAVEILDSPGNKSVSSVDNKKKSPKKRKKKASPAKKSKNLSPKKKKSAASSPAKPLTTVEQYVKTREAVTDVVVTDTDTDTPTSTAIAPVPCSMMDVKVHRIRCLNYIPRAILCLAPSPTSSSSTTTTPFTPQLLAISREGGGVTLCTPSERYRTISSIAGLSTRPMDALVWIQTTNNNTNSICVGGSRDGTVAILDFGRGIQRNVVNVGGGAVLSLVSMGSQVGVGCEDGSIRILDGELGLVTTLPTAGTVILSLAYHPNGLLFAGCADGTIRRYDRTNSGGGITSGNSGWRAGLRMTTTSQPQARKSANILSTSISVWSLVVLADYTLIAGDSGGNVTFYDGRQGVYQTHFLHNEYRADVLTVTKSRNERQVFASGIDNCVVCFELLQNDDNTSGRWLMTSKQRPHTHDVRSLATLHDTDGGHEILVSGGVDTKLCSYQLDQFLERRPRKIFPWPTHSPVQLSSQGSGNNGVVSSGNSRLLIMTRAECVDLYILPLLPTTATTTTTATMDAVNSDGLTQIGSIRLHEEGTTDAAYNIHTSRLSPDGTWLVVGTNHGMRLFSLSLSQTIDEETICEIVHVDVPSVVQTMICSSFGFTPDNENLVCADSLTDSLTVLTLGEEVSVRHTFRDLLPTEDDVPTTATVPISQLEFSHDGQWMAVLRNSLHSNTTSGDAIDVFNLTTMHHWWTLPKLQTAPTASTEIVTNTTQNRTNYSITALKFLGGSATGTTTPSTSTTQTRPVQPSLIVTCIDSSFYLFNVGPKTLSEWSQDAGIPIAPNLPPNLVSKFDYPTHIVSGLNDTSSAHADKDAVSDTINTSGRKFLLASHANFVAIDLDQPVPKVAPTIPPGGIPPPTPPPTCIPVTTLDHTATITNCDTANSGPNKNVTICYHYNHVLHLDLVLPNKMVVVKQPWFDMLHLLPDALARNEYGV
mmetsp:Transcript_23111/g.28355  ORF Transcript_23111/g.28355 Transcript_23111/m.28355 type:complete len:1032 (+) Transcript_23111:30-3125(+)